ncbi:hypothetical protein DPMN_033828 [Dreissena polymorpha]|uniref:Uncharacterized protein n=1 Tax=Dreissena polymorpha TaxID=45954 RepID=A0A9D4M6F5_DREPO|nr:hypothetical protein DPMN_033828 [Dreissena polymorpha]
MVPYNTIPNIIRHVYDAIPVGPGWSVKMPCLSGLSGIIRVGTVLIHCCCGVCPCWSVLMPWCNWIGGLWKTVEAQKC